MTNEQWGGNLIAHFFPSHSQSLSKTFMNNLFLHQRNNIVFFSIIICLLFSASAAFAAPGDLDPTFGSGGKVLTPISTNGNDVGRAVALQPDGKTVVAGYSFNSTNFDFAVRGIDFLHEFRCLCATQQCMPPFVNVINVIVILCSVGV